MYRVVECFLSLVYEDWPCLQVHTILLMIRERRATCTCSWGLSIASLFDMVSCEVVDNERHWKDDCVDKMEFVDITYSM